ncbi:MAG: hypothetical protein JWM34_98 [Ilumatobacteraceae bacterium]|nr:hypothetical protein [Ilumatobacteraceae bacterium]
MYGKKARGGAFCIAVALLSVPLIADAHAAAATSTTPTRAPRDGADDQGTALRAELSARTAGRAAFGEADDGDVTFIGGSAQRPLQAASNASLTSVGRTFVDQFAPLFGIADASRDLRQTQAFTGDTDTGGAARYQQTVSGVPVIAGVIAVQVAANGAVLSSTGEATDQRGIDTTPTVAPQDAAASAVALTARAAGVDASVLDAGTPTLSVYDPSLLDIDDPLGTRLVWQFAVRSAAGDVNRYVLIDAHDGTVALQFDQVEAALNRTVCDNDNHDSLPETCTSPVRVEGQAPVADSSTVSAADVNSAYDLSGVTYDFYSSRFGRDSLDGAGLPLASTVRYCDPTQPCPYANAYWNGNQMVYGAGFATADDVVGHELTHGVTQFTSGLIYEGQSGALNESMSDVMGEYIDLTSTVSGADPPSDRWNLGEQIPGGAIRNMANPTLFANPDKMSSGFYYLGSADNRGVHENSGVNNKAAYLIADGGSFNGQTITGLGIDKAAKIYYQLETTLLTPGSNYSDVYRQLPQACTNLIGVVGITSSDCQQVAKTVVATEMSRKPGDVGTAVPVCASGVRNAIAFADDMETDSGNWVGSTNGHGATWTYSTQASTSGNRSMHVVDNAAPAGTSTLAMARSVPVPLGKSSFSFEHSVQTDTDSGGVYDGGVVEYSTDGGSTWTDIDGSLSTPSLGAVHDYPIVLSKLGSGSPAIRNPLNGRLAFGGFDAGFVTTIIDTSPLAGQSVRFRYVFGIDNFPTTVFPGWFIDDVSLYGCGTASVPQAPIAVVATPGNAQASLTWSTPAFDGGATITGYAITPSIGGVAQATTTVANITTAVVTNLTNGSPYTFTVTALNAAGSSASSAASNVVTPTGPPSAPTGVAALAGDGAVTVSWTTPTNDGGSPITGYAITPIADDTALNPILVGVSSTFRVSGLANGVVHRFTVTARNALGTGSASAPSAPVTPQGVVSLAPGRLLDTRAGGPTVDGLFSGLGLRSADSTTPLSVLGRAGIPADAAAVTLNVTITGADASGFVTVYPCGADRPTASNVNFALGQTVANLVVSKVGPAGQVCLYTDAAAHLIVDASGFVPISAGLTPVVPARLLETRPGLTTADGVSNGIGQLAAGSVTTVQITGRAGIPANATATVVNLTATNPGAAGYLTAYPCGQQPPTASNLNFDAGQTIANAAFVKLGDGGTICVYANVATDAVLDVGGSFAPGASFTPLAPARLLDSRAGGVTVDGQQQNLGLLADDSVTQVAVAGRGGVPAGARSVVLNVTATDSTATGFITVYACGTPRPGTSNLNTVEGGTVAAAVIATLGTGGTVCVYTQHATHLVVDVDGAFTG